MTNPTDTNQASEDELVTEVTDILNNNLHPSCECQDCIITWSDSAAIPLVVELIRTEKLKLLAEVRELLIDRIPVYDGDDSFGKEYQAGYNSMAHATRTMQLQQSAELTKLEAEL